MFAYWNAIFIIYYWIALQSLTVNILHSMILLYDHF